MLKRFARLSGSSCLILSCFTFLLLLTVRIPAQEIPETPLSPPTNTLRPSIVGAENGISKETLLEPLASDRAFQLKGNYPVENLTNSAQIVGGSNLISPLQANQIAGYLNEGNVTLTNIFSKTFGDGKTSSAFHAAADGKGRSITVMVVRYAGQNYLIGGYNPQSWHGAGSYNVTNANVDRTAFLFNLTSDFIERQKLSNDPVCFSCGQYQTYNWSSYGPTFGGGHDIFVDSTLQAGYTENFTYGPSINANDILNIGVGFADVQVLGIEVFTVSECAGQYAFVGSYRVSDGPQWPTNPPTYTGQEAAALLFGGSAGDYAISVNSSSDPATITHTAWMDGWGDTRYFGSTAAPENYKLNTFYNCGSGACSFSAYIRDHVNLAKINYVWRRVSCNTAPGAIADAYATNEDTLLTVPVSGVLGNDSDPESDPLTAMLVAGPANALSFTLNPNGSFNYTSNQDFNGTDSFTYKANDGDFDSNVVTVTITINAVNDPPVLSGVPANAIIPEQAAYGFTATASDIESSPLVFSLVGGPAGASIDPNTGAFSWTPTESQGPGIFNFTIRVTDIDGAIDELPISLDVQEVNIAPSLIGVPSAVTIDELSPYGFTASATDADVPTQSLMFSLIGAPAGSNIDPNTGQFSWTPNESQGPGVHSFTVRVSDGVANTDAAITLTVDEINSAPVLAAIANQIVDEETVFGLNASANDGDTPANVLTYSLEASPAAMSIDPMSGAISWTPTESDGPGDYPVTVRVADDGSPGLLHAVSFSVHVNEVNIAPELDAIGNKIVDENTLLTFDTNASDVDLPANGMTFSLVSGPAGASIDPATGVFNWTPNEAQGGNPNSQYVFVVRVTDDGTPALSDEEQITVTVNEVNSPPVLGAISNQTGVWGNAFSFAASATDPDIPANTLAFSLIGAPAGASIDPSTGAFAWTPSNLQIGMHSFTVRVTDNGSPAMFDEQSVTINVGRRPTMLVYTGDGSEQYSDQQALSATLTDGGNGMPIVGRNVGFVIGSQSSGGVTDGLGVAASGLVLTQDPAPVYTVASSFAGDAFYLPASDSDAFDILQEDARAYYTGTLFVNTACATCGNGVATLSATIKDITAESSDPATDPFAGDIRNARVSFVDRDGGVIAANLPVGLVDPSDTKTGTVTFNWNINIGSADSMDYTIGIIVTNYYSRNSSEDNVVVTVSKPIGTNFITGGGYLVMSDSNGQYPGLDGTKENFGFNVKYSKNSKTLQGRVNVIFRGAGGRVYQIKGNVMRTLTVNATNPSLGKAVWTGKANLTDITDPLAPISLGGNNTFQMEMTDRGEPGSADTISVNLWNDAGGLLHSSNWNGTRTIEQLLGGGNVVVR